MSYTRVYAMPKTGPVEPVETFRNSYGFGARIWTSMSLRYFNEKPDMFGEGAIQKVWDLWKNPEVPVAYRAVMLSTFDYAVIEWERLREMAAHYRAFRTSMPVEEQAADHLLEISELLEDLFIGQRRDMAGVCFYPMSVAEDLWEVPDDGEEDECRFYDFSRDEGHWFVFAELEGKETQ